MTPEPSASSYTPTPRLGPVGAVADLASWTAGGLAVLLALAAGMLLWRCAAGALTGPLATATVVAVGLPLVAVVVGARLAMRLPAHGVFRPVSGWLVPGGLSLAIVAIGIALTLPGASLAGLVVLWSVLAVEEFWAWGPAARRRRPSSTLRRPVTSGPASSDAPAPATPHAAPPPAEPPAEEVTQQLTRSEAADGGETLAGWLRVGFAPGQRVANVHVAFCPPFGRTPRARLEQLEGPAARIKTGQVLPYGARFDLKLSGPAEEPATVLLRITAQARSTGDSPEG